MSFERSKRGPSITPEKPPSKRISVSTSARALPSKDIKDAIMNALRDSSVLNTISSMILDSVIESLEPTLQEKVDDAVDDALVRMRREITQKDELISALQDRVLRLEKRAEEQEQYSRRNCLRFSNVPYRTTDGSVSHNIGEMDTDAIVLDICNSTLGVHVTLDDISRSHVVGTPRGGKCQVIARFNSYRTRHRVYSAKSKMKSDRLKRFICEDLTRSRYKVVQHLSGLRKAKKITQFWTLDGRIFMRMSVDGPKILVKSVDDVNSHLPYHADTDEDDSQQGE